LNIETENRSASDSASFGSRKFDVIYHKDLLYHLHHPKEAFLNFTEKLKDDGVLIFETGNLADVSKIWLKLLGRLDYPEHVYLFSDKSVRELLKISGLELITEYYYSIIPILLIQKALSSFKYGFKISQKTKVKGNLNENFTTLQKIKGFLTHLLTCRLNRFFPHCLPSKIIYVTRKKKKLINRNDEL
jgi:SAM-dependent methyltransferase